MTYVHIPWYPLVGLLSQVSNFSQLQEQEKFELECLQSQLSVETPMKPLNGFELNFNTILVAIGLMTTYTIVLLQFKLDEMANMTKGE